MNQFLSRFQSKNLLLLLVALSIMSTTLKSNFTNVDKLSIGNILDVSNNDGMSSSPKIQVSDTEEIFLAWGDSQAAPSDIFFANSSDSGVSFGSVVNLSNDDNHS